MVGTPLTWYLDANGTNPVALPFNSATTTIYAIVSDGNCTSPIEAIELTVADLPEANPTTIANCDRFAAQCGKVRDDEKSGTGIGCGQFGRKIANVLRELVTNG